MFVIQSINYVHHLVGANLKLNQTKLIFHLSHLIWSTYNLFSTSTIITLYLAINRYHLQRNGLRQKHTYNDCEMLFQCLPTKHDLINCLAELNRRIPHQHGSNSISTITIHHLYLLLPRLFTKLHTLYKTNYEVG